MAACSHHDQVATTVAPSDTSGCTECLAIGSAWLHVRICMSCGQVGCCDSSPNKHASRHASASRHPVAASVEPGEDWLWCYVDEVAFVLPGYTPPSHDPY